MKLTLTHYMILALVVVVLLGIRGWHVAKATSPAPVSAEEEGMVVSMSGLRWRDDVEGTGPKAEFRDNVAVHYTGMLYPSGQKFDSSLDRGEPYTFRLGVGQVIQGWHLGIKGMKVGGKRTLIVPPHLAYGEEGNYPVIPPNATLRFEVELVEIK